MLDPDFTKADFTNCHGLVMGVPGTRETAQKLADSLLENGFCDGPVEQIYNPQPDVWALVWPATVGVRMPFILQKMKATLPGFQYDTLYHFMRMVK